MDGREATVETVRLWGCGRTASVHFRDLGTRNFAARTVSEKYNIAFNSVSGHEWQLICKILILDFVNCMYLNKIAMLRNTNILPSSGKNGECENCRCWAPWYVDDHEPWSVVSFRTSTWNVRHDIHSGMCLVDSSGVVTCVSRTVYFSICAPDIAYWPYDAMNCSVQIGSWMQTGEEIAVNTNHGIVSTYIQS